MVNVLMNAQMDILNTMVPVIVVMKIVLLALIMVLTSVLVVKLAGKGLRVVALNLKIKADIQNICKRKMLPELLY